MATVPTPRTWTVGELLTAAKLNTDLRDGLNIALSPPLAVLLKTVGQSIASGSLVSVTWDDEGIDRDGGHSNVTNNSRYTSQTAGWYHLSGLVEWVTGGTDTRQFDFRKNGTDSYTRQFEPDTGGQVSGAMYLFLAVNDYVEVRVAQTSGASVNTVGHGNGRTRFEIVWVSTS